MGASESLLAVEGLRDRIVSLEEKVVSLESECRVHEALTYAKGQVLLCADTAIQCNEGVKVVVGPVIGLVTSSTARVLLEVDKDATITCHLCRLSKENPVGFYSGSVSQELPAFRPRVFLFQDLSPGERYVMYVEGVRRQDAEQRIGKFHTIPEGKEEVRLVAVSCNAPQRLDPSDGNGVWRNLAARVDPPPGDDTIPRVDVILHLGGQVWLKESVELSLAHLKQSLFLMPQEGEDFPGPGRWRAAEYRMEEKLREVYRFTWNLPFVKEVLMSCANLMLPGDRDVYPDYTRCQELSSQGSNPRCAAMLMRIVRRVTEEYQGQLWHGHPGDAVERLSAELSQACVNLYYIEHEKEVKEGELSKMEKAFFAARLLKDQEEQANARGGNEGDKSESQTGAGEVLTYLQGKLDELRGEVATLRKEEITATNSLPSVITEPPALVVHLGMMALWAVDLRWGHVAPDGSLRLTNRQKLPKDQVAQVEKLLGGLGGQVRMLVLALEYPLVDVDGSQESSFWSEDDGDQALLLQMAVDWKAKAGDREVLVLAGGLLVGMDSCIRRRDRKNTPAGDAITIHDMEFRQLVPGPIADQWGSVVELEETGTVGKRGLAQEGRVFDFVHTFPVPERHYLEVVMRAEDEVTTSIDREFVRASLCGVAAILGPVVGEVTCQSAVVLLEVDAGAAVTCIASDTLSGRQHKMTRRMVAGRPCPFVFNSLEANRNYEVHFKGLDHGDDRRGSFTTPCPPSTPHGTSTYNLMVLSGDILSKPTALQLRWKDRHAAALREAQNQVTGLMSQAWGAVDGVVMVGEVVDLDIAMSEAGVLLYSAEAEPPSSQARKALEVAASERLRDAYRTYWSLPENRRLLSRGAHLMVRSQHVLPASEDKAWSPYCRETMSRLLQKLHEDYHCQLWCAGGEEDKGIHVSTWGPVTILALDPNTNWQGNNNMDEKPFISPRQWEALGEALSRRDLRCVIIISDPVVDDSPLDAVAKSSSAAAGRMGPVHDHGRWCDNRKDLMKLLRTLAEWQSREVGREAVLCGDGGMVGVETVIRWAGQSHEGPSLHQYLCGPMVEPKVLPAYQAWCEPSGQLDTGWTYSHSTILRACSIVLLTASKDMYGKCHIRGQVLPLPAKPSQDTVTPTQALLRVALKARRSTLLKVLQGSSPPVAYSRVTLVDKMMASPQVQRALPPIFQAMQDKNLLLQDSPPQLAQSLLPYLLGCYHHHIPTTFHRHGLPAPSAFVIEHVVRQWTRGRRSSGSHSQPTMMPQPPAAAAPPPLGGETTDEREAVVPGTTGPAKGDDGKVDQDRESSLWLYVGWEVDVEEEEGEKGEVEVGGGKLIGGWGDGKVRVPLRFGDSQHFERFFGDCFRAAIILQSRQAAV